MSGIYIHIPFCRQACHYCDFHFSTSLKFKDDFIQALLKEVELRKNYLPTKNISTIYFGGGTPSLLTATELKQIFEKISNVFSVDEHAEITLEANPDDLTKEKLLELRQTPVNRLSIGIQSFSDADLKFMNRAHHAEQARISVLLAQDAGYYNF
jgi:oxygen-independent coproporphyrinogen-3 oxidase